MIRSFQESKEQFVSVRFDVGRGNGERRASSPTLRQRNACLRLTAAAWTFGLTSIRLVTP
ncbi:hypothetical protein OOT46_25160 [Aquabacterium sp. A7-Y]|uniref:hypothetical protein n=1 Tax=Aquabacterium sp. A7-Y TaxID=1349605 RepID=UPI00223D16B6|nr:hypothetical protein [Aquabacterium sp. A7-Y]MCW7541108.1 hypothetical protein [Aquabacterium sp. A7-Y]